VKLTTEQLNEILSRPSMARANPVSGKGTHTIPERTAIQQPIQEAGNEGGDSGKLLIRVKSLRRRLLDEDNLVEKWHVDALRYAGVLYSDAPDKAKIEVSQEKVTTKEEECTVITIERMGE
jgi:hypothetical protein